jgi:anti-sigma regulatory factor (Ser/Thr protein kinase)
VTVSPSVLPHLRVADGPRQMTGDRERGTAAGPGAAGGPGTGGSAWPLESYLELGAFPGAVSCARLHARLVLTEWGLGAMADTGELVVSELVTNAVTATEGLIASRYGGQRRPGRPPVRLWLQSDLATLVVMVWDGGDGMPRRVAPDPGSQSGRGLWLVEARSDEWGVFRPDGATGKVVWARITRP